MVSAIHAVVAIMLTLAQAALAQTGPDLARGNYAQKPGPWSALGPAVIFFVGILLVIGVLLLGRGGGKRPPGPPRFPRFDRLPPGDLSMRQEHQEPEE